LYVDENVAGDSMIDDIDLGINNLSVHLYASHGLTTLVKEGELDGHGHLFVYDIINFCI
jgi:hypothetical protein